MWVGSEIPRPTTIYIILKVRKMRIVYQKFIWREEMKLNPHSIYIFGDNVKRVGFGGQAKEMRGEPNAFGIVTKLAPTYNPDDFMKDTQENFDLVAADFEHLFMELKRGNYDTLVVPADGIGTGIAKLKETAPLILLFINRMLFNDIRTKWNV